MDFFLCKRVENGKLPGIMQQTAGKNDFTTKVFAFGRDHVLQDIVLSCVLSIQNFDQFFLNSKLNQGNCCLTKRTFGKLLSGNAIRETGDIHDLFVSIEELRLTSTFAGTPIDCAALTIKKSHLANTCLIKAAGRIFGSSILICSALLIGKPHFCPVAQTNVSRLNGHIR